MNLIWHITKLHWNGSRRKWADREGGPCTRTRSDKMSAFSLFLFHLLWYQIGCYSKNIVLWNECAHAFLKSSLYLIAMEFVCLCFLESKTRMFSASVWVGKTHKKQSMVLFVPLFSIRDLDKWKSSNDRFDDGRLFIKSEVNSKVIIKISDQCQYLINCTPTPPLTQH